MNKSEHIIEKFAQGDANALSQLYDMYSGALYTIILKICKEQDLANDVLQETFVSIWQNSHAYNPNLGRFYTWAYRIARNKALNTVRTKKNLIQTEDLGVYTNEEATESLAMSEVTNTLKGALASLESHHKRAIELVYFNGLTHREAHSEMDVPLGTFKSYIQQALRELKKIMPKEVFAILWVLVS